MGKKDQRHPVSGRAEVYKATCRHGVKNTVSEDRSKSRCIIRSGILRKPVALLKDTRNRAMVLVVLTFLVILTIVVKSYALDVTLTWDPNEDADYYVVYYGTEPGNYTLKSDNIPVPTVEYTVMGLDPAIWYFSVKAFNQFGNSSDFSDEVSYVAFYSPLEVEIESPSLYATISEGESLNFQGYVSGGTAPLTYAWNFGVGGPVGSSVEDPGYVTFDNPGIYNVSFTVTDSNGAIQTVTVTVTVDPRYLDIDPVVDITSPSGNPTIVEGDSVLFEGHVANGNAPYTYHWNFGVASIPDSHVEDPGFVVFSEAGTHQVTFTVVDADGDISVSTLTVSVNDRIVDVEPLASISSPDSDVMLIQGQSVVFNGTVSGGNAPLVHNWNFGGSGIADSGLEDPGSRIFNNIGTFTVTYSVTDDDGDVDRVVRTVTVIAPDTNPSAAITSPASNVTILKGGSVSFAATVTSGNAPFTHVWSFGDSGVAPKTMEDPGSLIFSSVGSFTVMYTVTDSDGDVSSSVRTVTVVEPDTNPVAAISSPSTNMTITRGGSVTFAASVSGGNAPFVHAWDFGLSGISAKNVEDPGSVLFTNTGLFTVTYTVTDSDGDVSNASRTVTVVEPDTNPVASISSPSANVTITQGGNVSFAATVSGGNAPYTHVWNFGASGVNSRTVEDPGNLTFNTLGTFTVTYSVTDKDGDTSSASRIVTVVEVDTSPTASISSPSANVTVAVGSVVNFAASVAGGNAPYTHDWSFGSSAMAGKIVEDPGNVTFNSLGTYVVIYKVTDADGDTSSATRTVTVVEPDTNPTASISSPLSNVTVTQGGSVNFSAVVSSGNAPYAHVWDFGESGIPDKAVEDPGAVTFFNVGTYTVTYTVTDADGDTGSVTRIVTVSEPDTNPVAAITSPSAAVTVVKGESLNFQATVSSGNAPFTHNWNFGASGLVGQSVEDPGSQAFETLGTFAVTYTVIDADGDTSSATCTVTVAEPDTEPVVTVTAPQDHVTVIQGGTVTFSSTVSAGNAPFNYTWDFGESGVADSMSKDPGSQTFSILGSFIVTCTVTDADGDTHRATRTVTVVEPDTEPTAIIASPSSNETITQGSGLVFMADVTGGNGPYTHVWNFGPSGVAERHVEDPGAVIFDVVGTFTVTYTVTDADGDTSRSLRTVTVTAAEEELPYYSPLEIAIEAPVLYATINEGESMNFQGYVLGGATPLTFSWNFGLEGPTGVSVEDPGDVTFDHPGTYTVTFTVTDSNGDLKTTTVVVTVEQIYVDMSPVIEIVSPTGDLTITEGEAVEFAGHVAGGNAPFNILWNFGTADIPDSSEEDPGSVVFTDPGAYTVTFTVVDSDGDIVTDTLTVTVDDQIVDVEPVAVISSPETDMTVIQGASVLLAGMVTSGNDPLTHDWDFGDSGIDPVAGEDPGNLTFSRTGSFTVTYTVTDGDGDVSSATRILTVVEPDTNPVTAINSPSGNVTVTQGGSVSFGAMVSGGNEPYTHAWTFGESGLTPRDVLAPGTLTFNTLGTFSVIYTATDADGDVSSAVRTVTVVEPDTDPVVTMTSPSTNVKITQGGIVNFEATVESGNAPYTYLWNFASSGVSDRTVEDPGNVTFMITGTFTVTCTVTDRDGDTRNATRIVTVVEPDRNPVASIVSPSANVSVVQGGSIGFEGSVTSGNAPFTHIWNFGSSAMSPKTVEDPGSVTFNTLGTYTVTYTVTDSDGDKSTAMRTVTVVAPDTNPTATITSPSPNATIVQGESLSFSASVTSGNAPFTHAWNFGNSGVPVQSVEDPGNLTFNTVGVFNVTYTVIDADGDKSSSTRTVNVKEPDTVPVLTMTSPASNVTITRGETVNFTSSVSGGNQPYTHVWDFGESGIDDKTVKDPGTVTFDAVGTFTVTCIVTDADGDRESANRTVTVVEPDTNPVASIISPQANVTLTQGGSLNFTASVSSGNEPFTHTWNFGSSGVTAKTVKDPGTLTFNVLGTFTVTYKVTDADGDTSSASRVVTVVPPDTNPVASIASPATNVTVSQGGAVSFAATVTSGNDPFTYGWNFGTSGLAAQGVKDPGSLAFNALGTHTVTFTVTDADGDTSRATRTVTVVVPDTNPVASITSPTTNVIVNQGGAVNFGATVTSGNAPYTHAWNFGASGVAVKIVEDPGSVVFNTAGVFVVTYTVKDSDGDISSASRTVTVNPVTPPVPEEESGEGLVSYTLVSTTKPGVKSTDNFIPPTTTSIVKTKGERSTIKVTDSQLRHLLWLRSGWMNYNTVNGESRIATGDIDGDGKDEIIIGLSSENTVSPMPGGFFQLLDDNYGHMAWGRVEWAEYNERNGETWLACGDVDGDGKEEIIVGLGRYGGGYVEVFGWQNGMIVHKYWLRLQWPDYNEINGEVRPVCADVNGDGIEDIIAGLGSMSGSSSLSGGRFGVFSMVNGQWVHLLWGEVDWPEYAEMNGETWPACGDVDGDGKIELVIGLGQGSEGQMVIFEFIDGEPHQAEWLQIPWPEYNDIHGETRPLCGDVNMDGKDEVILGWSTTSSTGELLHYFKILTYDVNQKNWLNYRDTKSVDQMDIDSVPVRGSIAKDSRIYAGMGAGEDITPTPQEKEAGTSGGGGGCFIEALF